MKQEILDTLAPCGLNCKTCFAYAKGDIKKNAQELKELLGRFDIYANRFAILLKEPKFLDYPKFNELLDHFAGSGCEGCRKQSCQLYEDCKVRECAISKKVDFCFQCPEFPCKHSGFDKNLEERWISINNQMKEKGIEAYYEETKDQPRYV